MATCVKHQKQTEHHQLPVPCSVWTLHKNYIFLPTSYRTIYLFHNSLKSTASPGSHCLHSFVNCEPRPQPPHSHRYEVMRVTIWLRIHGSKPLFIYSENVAMEPELMSLCLCFSELVKASYPTLVLTSAVPHLSSDRGYAHLTSQVLICTWRARDQRLIGTVYNQGYNQ